MAVFKHATAGDETLLKLHTLPLDRELLERELARALDSEDYTKCALIHGAKGCPVFGR